MDSVQPRRSGARVCTASPIEFTFDGKTYCGFAGDTLASALLANGVRVFGRSFKLHRPRGVLGAGVEEPNALVQLEQDAYTVPNTRATLLPIYPGLHANGQNAFPNVRFDMFGALQLFKPLLPASFYYRTFMWPSWGAWEWLLRRLAGLGRAPVAEDPCTYVKQNAHVDVLVVGAGQSGIEAALTAASDPSCRVLLVDDQIEPGGSLLASPDPGCRRWLEKRCLELAERQNITLLPRTRVSGYYDGNTLSAIEQLGERSGKAAPQGPSQRLWRIFAGRVVLATGAIERPLVFPNNDRPGVMLASAVREYSFRYGLSLGKRVLFFCNNDSGWHTAIELASAGESVLGIVDVRHEVSLTLREAAADLDIATYLGCVISNTRGRAGLKSVQLSSLEESGESARLNCDLLAISGGWSPTLHLYSQAGCHLEYSERGACFVPGSTSRQLSVVGRANGDFATELDIRPFWFVQDQPASNQWVDLQYDVTVADIQLAARENYVSVEHVKRYTTNGMSVDQGKTSNVNGIAVLAAGTGRAVPEVGTTRFRPPYHPVTIGAFAGIEIGELYQPFQRLPAHDAHVDAGAGFEDYGRWKRPAFYPRRGENEHDAVSREALAVRTSVGVLDYSPLGKLEVYGADAREFLNRMYVNNIETLKVGGVRYGLILDEKGIVIDDGVVICIADDHFLLHTTSAGATRIKDHFEEWLQCEWPELRVVVNDNTTHWATMLVSGPNARRVVERLDSDIDLSPQAFPHMHYREGSLLGHPCRVLRTGFSGELSYELSVGARFGLSLWNAIMAVGNGFGITPFGIESLMLLRTEKGYLHVGIDTDGNTMPHDLGWQRAIDKKEADFVGRRSLTVKAGRDAQRFQFTGIKLVDSKARISPGAHVVTEAGGETTGYVTSAFYSPVLERTVALGLVAGAFRRRGEDVTLFCSGRYLRAQLVVPCQYDPEDEAINA